MANTRTNPLWIVLGVVTFFAVCYYVQNWRHNSQNLTHFDKSKGFRDVLSDFYGNAHIMHQEIKIGVINNDTDPDNQNSASNQAEQERKMLKNTNGSFESAHKRFKKKPRRSRRILEVSKSSSKRSIPDTQHRRVRRANSASMATLPVEQRIAIIDITTDQLVGGNVYSHQDSTQQNGGSETSVYLLNSFGRPMHQNDRMGTRRTSQRYSHNKQQRFALLKKRVDPPNALNKNPQATRRHYEISSHTRALAHQLQQHVTLLSGLKQIRKSLDTYSSKLCKNCNYKKSRGNIKIGQKVPSVLNFPENKRNQLLQRLWKHKVLINNMQTFFDRLKQKNRKVIHPVDAHVNVRGKLDDSVNKLIKFAVAKFDNVLKTTDGNRSSVFKNILSTAFRTLNIVIEKIQEVSKNTSLDKHVSSSLNKPRVKKNKILKWNSERVRNGDPSSEGTNLFKTRFLNYAGFIYKTLSSKVNSNKRTKRSSFRRQKQTQHRRRPHQISQQRDQTSRKSHNSEVGQPKMIDHNLLSEGITSGNPGDGRKQQHLDSFQQNLMQRSGVKTRPNVIGNDLETIKNDRDNNNSNNNNDINKGKQYTDDLMRNRMMYLLHQLPQDKLHHVQMDKKQSLMTGLGNILTQKTRVHSTTRVHKHKHPTEADWQLLHNIEILTQQAMLEEGAVEQGKDRYEGARKQKTAQSSSLHYREKRSTTVDDNNQEGLSILGPQADKKILNDFTRSWAKFRLALIKLQQGISEQRVKLDQTEKRTLQFLVKGDELVNAAESLNQLEAASLSLKTEMNITNVFGALSGHSSRPVTNLSVVKEKSVVSKNKPVALPGVALKFADKDISNEQSDSVNNKAPTTDVRQTLDDGEHSNADYSKITNKRTTVNINSDNQTSAQTNLDNDQIEEVSLQPSDRTNIENDKSDEAHTANPENEHLYQGNSPKETLETVKPDIEKGNDKDEPVADKEKTAALTQLKESSEEAMLSNGNSNETRLTKEISDEAMSVKGTSDEAMLANNKPDFTFVNHEEENSNKIDSNGKMTVGETTDGEITDGEITDGEVKNSKTFENKSNKESLNEERSESYKTGLNKILSLLNSTRRTRRSLYLTQRREQRLRTRRDKTFPRSRRPSLPVLTGHEPALVRARRSVDPTKKELENELATLEAETGVHVDHAPLNHPFVVTSGHAHDYAIHPLDLDREIGVIDDHYVLGNPHDDMDHIYREILMEKNRIMRTLHRMNSSTASAATRREIGSRLHDLHGVDDQINQLQLEKKKEQITRENNLVKEMQEKMERQAKHRLQTLQGKISELDEAIDAKKRIKEIEHRLQNKVDKELKKEQIEKEKMEKEEYEKAMEEMKFERQHRLQDRMRKLEMKEKEFDHNVKEKSKHNTVERRLKSQFDKQRSIDSDLDYADDFVDVNLDKTDDALVQNLVRDHRIKDTLVDQYMEQEMR